jgi:hypothetical protein
MLYGLLLTLLLAVTPGRLEPDRNNRAGFREKVPCIENGKFYRDPNMKAEYAFR